MTPDRPTAHPYIPNSVPHIKQRMLDVVGAATAADLFSSIPADLQLAQPLDLPSALLSEHDLKRHMAEMLADVVGTDELVSFLGGGCARHFVPAVCDEIAGRREFLTAYAGDAYSDHGKHQAWFEYQSLMGELLDMDFVSFPTYDAMAASSSALLMAARATGRSRVIVAESMHPDRRSHLANFARASLNAVDVVAIDRHTGLIDRDDLAAKLDSDVAALYLESPSYLGPIDPGLPELVEQAHDCGALAVVAVDPISLGVLAPPSTFGADLVVGDAQPLGLHPHGGGATCGFIASAQDPRLIAEYPTLLETIVDAEGEGAWGFGWTALDQTSFGRREAATDLTGTTSGLWAITVAVYLSVMGPAGMREVGETIMRRTRYAARRMAQVPGVELAFSAPFFKEIAVRFDGTGLTVAQINERLLEHGVLGGHDLSREFADLGQLALYCCTELTTKADIDQMVEALAQVTS